MDIFSLMQQLQTCDRNLFDAFLYFSGACRVCAQTVGPLALQKGNYYQIAYKMYSQEIQEIHKKILVIMEQIQELQDRKNMADSSSTTEAAQHV